jgi:hypothetical protein
MAQFAQGMTQMLNIHALTAAMGIGPITEQADAKRPVVGLAIGMFGLNQWLLSATGIGCMGSSVFKLFLIAVKK